MVASSIVVLTFAVGSCTMGTPSPAPATSLDPSQRAAQGFAAAFVDGSSSSSVAERTFACPSNGHFPFRPMALSGFEGARLSGIPIPGPDPNDPSLSPRALNQKVLDMHVPFEATKDGVPVKGSISITLGQGGRCVAGVGVVIDPPAPSGTPSG